MSGSTFSKTSAQERRREAESSALQLNRRPASQGPEADILNLQRSVGNQAVNRYLGLGSLAQSQGEKEESLVVITDEGSTQECTDFYIRDPEISDTRTGTLVHKALQNWMDANGFGERFKPALPTGSKAPLKDKRQIIGGRRQGPGYFDLAYKSERLRTVEGAEVKPANPNGFTEGIEDLKWYLDKGNSDEDFKRQNGIIEFRPMEPWKFPLPHPLYVESRMFRLIWCMPGLILYKEVTERKKKRDQKTKTNEASKIKSLAKEERRHEAAANLTARIQPGDVHGSRLLVLSQAVSPEEASIYIWGREDYADSLIGESSSELAPGRFNKFRFGNVGIRAIYMRPALYQQFLNAWSDRPVTPLPEWAPTELKEAYRSGTIPIGLSVNTWKYEWPGGFVAPILVSRHADIVEIQALWPAELEFYQLFAKRVGESETFARQLHSVCVEWNKDIVSLLDDEGEERYISIDAAKDRLRGINQEIQRAFLGALVAALGAAGGLSRAPTEVGAGVRSRPRLPSKAPQDSADEIIEWLNRLLNSGNKSPKRVPVVPL